jgi:hypothetical protein
MNFTWKTKCCIAAFIIGILLNLRTSQAPRMSYKHCKFGCDRSINRAPYLEYNVLFRSYIDVNWSNSPLTRYLSLHALAVQTRTFACIRSIFKSTLTGEQYAFATYFGFHRKDFPVTSRLAVSVHVLQALLSLVAIGE